MDISDREHLSRLTDKVAAIGVAIASLDSRAARVDNRLSAVEQDLAVIKSNYATGADVLRARISIILWVVGAVFFAQVLAPVLKALPA
jgi:hypothetical protein